MLLTPSPKLPGTDGRKMSKSYGNTILLTDPEPVIRQKLKTDGDRSGAGAADGSGQSGHVPGGRSAQGLFDAGDAGEGVRRVPTRGHRVHRVQGMGWRIRLCASWRRFRSGARDTEANPKSARGDPSRRSACEARTAGFEDDGSRVNEAMRSAAGGRCDEPEETAESTGAKQLRSRAVRAEARTDGEAEAREERMKEERRSRPSR